MTPLFKKLNLKAQSTIHVLNAPLSLDAELAALQGVEVMRSAEPPIRFAMAFAITQAELDVACAALIDGAEGDAVLWIAYPKGTSKKYRCEFNRDSGWAVLGADGYEPVRMVAIDDDWSALRFRKADRIRSLTRDPQRAVSTRGQQRAAAAGVSTPTEPEAE